MSCISLHNNGLDEALYSKIQPGSSFKYQRPPLEIPQTRVLHSKTLRALRWVIKWPDTKLLVM